MDCAPLNLAHFHERRAEKFLKKHRYDDAYKAIETSLFYVQDAYKSASIAKSVEVLDTQKWDYERKLCQIQIRKQQYERVKLREIVPITTETYSLKPESSTVISKSIDKTIQDFNAKFNNQRLPRKCQHYNRRGSKENQTPRDPPTATTTNAEKATQSISDAYTDMTSSMNADTRSTGIILAPHTEWNDEAPSLAPLELPSFDFNVFVTSTPLLNSIAEFRECSESIDGCNKL